MDIVFHEGRPFFEEVCIEDIINSLNTPFYLYSQKSIEDKYINLKDSLKSEIFYSVKANSNQAVLGVIKNCGSGADVVSSGELERALEAGFEPNKIIFEGVGKSEEDIRYAINKKIRFHKGQPIKPFDQLMLILPPQMSKILPVHYINLMLQNNSPIKHLYPNKFELDVYPGQKLIYTEPILPNLDVISVTKETKKIESTLSKTDKNRNTILNKPFEIIL